MLSVEEVVYEVLSALAPKGTSVLGNFSEYTPLVASPQRTETPCVVFV
jgi:hypothetical protein